MNSQTKEQATAINNKCGSLVSLNLDLTKNRKLLR